MVRNIQSIIFQGCVYVESSLAHYFLYTPLMLSKDSYLLGDYITLVSGEPEELHHFLQTLLGAWCRRAFREGKLTQSRPTQEFNLLYVHFYLISFERRLSQGN